MVPRSIDLLICGSIDSFSYLCSIYLFILWLIGCPIPISIYWSIHWLAVRLSFWFIDHWLIDCLYLAPGVYRARPVLTCHLPSAPRFWLPRSAVPAEITGRYWICGIAAEFRELWYSSHYSRSARLVYEQPKKCCTTGFLGTQNRRHEN